jgi:hypothetical protein
VTLGVFGGCPSEDWKPRPSQDLRSGDGRRSDCTCRTDPAYLQDDVIAALDDPAQFQRDPLIAARGTPTECKHAFVLQDGPTISAHWPGESYLFAERFKGMLRQGNDRGRT